MLRLSPTNEKSLLRSIIKCEGLLCKIILYIYHTASRGTHQNISPEVTQEPWRIMSPDAEGNNLNKI